MKSKYIGFFLVAVAVGIIIIFALTGCNTFEIHNDPKQPPDCNDMYTFSILASKMSGPFSKENTSAAVALNLITLKIPKCETARENMNEENKIKTCLKTFYINSKKIKPYEINYDKKDYKNKTQFFECLNK